jgi:hypothetical protein
MECTIEKIDSPVETYIHTYHTGDPQLDELLGFFKNSKNKTSPNVKISHSSQVPNKSFKLAKRSIQGCNFIIRNDRIVMEIDHANIVFTTKEEFAILKKLLESSIFSLILNEDNVYNLFDDPDLLCTFNVRIERQKIMLVADYVNIKYKFEYTHRSKIMNFNTLSVETLVKFMNTICISTDVSQKLKNVQIYLLIGDREIPGYFPDRRHKIVIENTYSINYEANIKYVLDDYINNDKKYSNLLPTGKSAKEIC